MVDAASMMPRCLTEISRTQGILKTLESEMASLAIQLQEFDQRNINGVEDLSRYWLAPSFCCPLSFASHLHSRPLSLSRACSLCVLIYSWGGISLH